MKFGPLLAVCCLAAAPFAHAVNHREAPITALDDKADIYLGLGALSERRRQVAHRVRHASRHGAGQRRPAHRDDVTDIALRLVVGGVLHALSESAVAARVCARVPIPVQPHQRISN